MSPLPLLSHLKAYLLYFKTSLSLPSLLTSTAYNSLSKFFNFWLALYYLLYLLSFRRRLGKSKAPSRLGISLQQYCISPIKLILINYIKKNNIVYYNDYILLIIRLLSYSTIYLFGYEINSTLSAQYSQFFSQYYVDLRPYYQYRFTALWN